MNPRAALLAALLPVLAGATATKKGIVTIDAFTFDKVVESQDSVVVKFDVEYPYGDKEDEWKKLAARTARMKKPVVIAEVGVQDYGEDEYNERLRDRFGIKSADYPAVMLFRGKNAKEPAARFKGVFDEKGIADFLKEHLKIDLGEIKREEKKPENTASSTGAGDSADRGETPQYIEVTSEEMAFLTGIYTLLEERHNDEPVWGLDDLRIFANNQGTWMLSDESNLRDDKGYVYSKHAKGSKWPSEHTEWLYYDGEKKEWVDCKETTVLVSGPPPPPGLADMLPDTRTMALIAAAFLFVLSLILFFTGGKEEKSDALPDADR
eukprot:TRINITY_DN212_c2_g1_i1.p1 TRINITY_DN212_c2_g1~~TRINITY_DN212_c2_g1_i1.p1  ORF type:complete len:322 (+),score=114.46 TRINITY_DN212_c2_g1_i1:73-1038(+)